MFSNLSILDDSVLECDSQSVLETLELACRISNTAEQLYQAHQNIVSTIEYLQEHDLDGEIICKMQYALEQIGIDIDQYSDKQILLRDLYNTQEGLGSALKATWNKIKEIFSKLFGICKTKGANEKTNIQNQLSAAANADKLLAGMSQVNSKQHEFNNSVIQGLQATLDSSSKLTKASQMAKEGGLLNALLHPIQMAKGAAYNAKLDAAQQAQTQLLNNQANIKASQAVINLVNTVQQEFDNACRNNFIPESYLEKAYNYVTNGKKVITDILTSATSNADKDIINTLADMRSFTQRTKSAAENGEELYSGIKAGDSSSGSLKVFSDYAAKCAEDLVELSALETKINFQLTEQNSAAQKTISADGNRIDSVNARGNQTADVDNLRKLRNALSLLQMIVALCNNICNTSTALHNYYTKLVNAVASK